MGKIEIRSDLCKSCRYCVKYCPKSVIEIGDNVNEKGYEYAVPVRMADCIACQICARMCPEGAIEVYR